MVDLAFLSQYVLTFPEATQKIFKLFQIIYLWFLNLSPKAKAAIKNAFDKTIDITIKVFLQLKAAYPFIMNLGDVPVNEWTQPSKYILNPITYIILLILPVSDQWEDFQTEKKVVFVGNQQIYALGTLSLVSAVYRRTGILLRVTCDEINYKIPVWKHLIQYFGTVTSNPENIKSLINNEDPVLFYPGGKKEFFKNRLETKYGLNFDQDMVDFVQNLAEENDYKIIPFGFIGASDMVTIVLDFPFGDRNIPIVLVKSYERQYLNVGSGNGRSFYDVSRQRNHALQRQIGDKNRYLLESTTKFISNVVKWSWNKILDVLSTEPKIKEL
jgi:hypothetical protein